MRRGLLGAAAFAAMLVIALGSASSAGAVALPFHATLTGAAQIASGLPGDPDGSGTASLSMDSTTNQVCYSITWSNIQAPVVAGHIHQGATFQPENPAFTVNLFGPNLSGASSGVSGCSLAVPGQIEAMELSPSLFEVTIHNEQYPLGAIRGQLVAG
jgi:hypothetical protein